MESQQKWKIIQDDKGNTCLLSEQKYPKLKEDSIFRFPFLIGKQLFGACWVSQGSWLQVTEISLGSCKKVINLPTIRGLMKLMGKLESYLEKYVEIIGGGWVDCREHHHITPLG